MENYQPIGARFLEVIQSNPDKEAYRYQVDGKWVSQTWGDYGRHVTEFAHALLASGLQKGDRITILSHNHPKWIIAAVGSMLVGVIPVGIYSTCSPSQISYINNDCGAKLFFMDNEKVLQNIEKTLVDKWDMPSVENFVVMHGDITQSRDKMISWDNFVQRASGDSTDLLATANDVREDDCISLIYTSGTTGMPKGVMISAKNYSFVANFAVKTILTEFNVPSESVYISYLPLAHVAEQAFSIVIHVYCGTGTLVYCESPLKLPEILKEAQPHYFFGPPRIWEKFYASIKGKLPPNVSPNQLPQEQVQGIRAMLGFSRCVCTISGAGPISTELINFFDQMGISIHEVYGQSEGSGPTSFNSKQKRKVGSVGLPLPGTEVRIAEDGEILVRGPNVFLGYWNKPEATNETVKDGWLYSGDVGRIDDEGFLFITGRKKDVIKTSGGKQITPSLIENELKVHPLVGEAIVVGDGRKYLVALISLDSDVLKALAAKYNITPEQFQAGPAVKAVSEHVEKVNSLFSRVEQIKKFKITQEPFSLEKSEMTPTMKARRHIINQNYKELIDSLYVGDEE